MAMKWHPDKNQTDAVSKTKAEEMFKKIGEAYAVLSDPQKRRQHNMEVRKRKRERKLKQEENKIQQHKNFFVCFVFCLDLFLFFSFFFFFFFFFFLRPTLQLDGPDDDDEDRGGGYDRFGRPKSSGRAAHYDDFFSFFNGGASRGYGGHRYDRAYGAQSRYNPHYYPGDDNEEWETEDEEYYN